MAINSDGANVGPRGGIGPPEILKTFEGIYVTSQLPMIQKL